MIYEWIYVTIHYACNHEALRPMRREAYEQDFPMHAQLDDRTIQAPENCPACSVSVLRAWERKMERRGVTG